MKINLLGVHGVADLNIGVSMETAEKLKYFIQDVALNEGKTVKISKRNGQKVVF
ncbi:unnamed protein product, partial [Aphanomyces euteiches]